MNAAMPSVWSSVANSEWNSRRSKRTPSARVVSNARLTHSFTIIVAGREKPAIFWAVLTASSTSSVGGTIRETRPQRFGFLRIHHATGQAKIHRLGLADEAGQALAAAGTRYDAEIDFRLPEPCCFRRNNEVAHHGDLASAAEGISGYRGNHRLAARAEPGPAADEIGLVGIREFKLCHLLDVSTGGERLL